MNNLRWLVRDGVAVLQQNEYDEVGEKYWVDIPLVTEPKKAREFYLEIPYMGGREIIAHWGLANLRESLKDQSFPTGRQIIKVREVLEPEPVPPVGGKCKHPIEKRKLTEPKQHCSLCDEIWETRFR